jgi:hypothetical protein
MSSGAQPVADVESRAITQSGDRRIAANTSGGSLESVLLLHIVSDGLPPTAVDPARNPRLREKRDDRPSALDD